MKATDKIKYLERLGGLLSYYEDYLDVQCKSDHEWELVNKVVEDLRSLILEFVKTQ